MSMFEKLSNEDVALFRYYLNRYGDYDGNISALPLEKMGYFLRFWESKKDLFHAFGEQFILKKEVMYEKSVEELYDEMSNVRYRSDMKIQNFISAFHKKTKEIFGDNCDAQWDMFSMVNDTESLIKNIYERDSFTISGKYTKDGRALTVQPGCKIVKMVGKIAQALEITEGYEEFRQAHSQVLNQKRIKGTLCLSIHPLDYITMSDNDCGWTSCMSWMEDPGDYRLGTIEMMNSPYVVVAYVEASDKMYIGNSNYWNSKRWRQLFIVTEELILGNRQYPYESDMLQGAAIKWLKNLCEKVEGYGPYLETPIQLRNYANNYIDGERQVYFDLDTSFMYNDVYDTRLAYVSPEIEDQYSLNFSGPAICVACGEEIEYESVDNCEVFCRNCGGEWRCECCGEWHHGEPCYDNDGNTYCSWCYANELEECAICGEPQGNLYNTFVVAHEEKDTPGCEYNTFDWEYHIRTCRACRGSTRFRKLYGDIFEIPTNWYNTKSAVDLKNITNEGLYRIDISTDDREYLKSLRDVKNKENS